MLSELQFTDTYPENQKPPPPKEKNNPQLFKIVTKNVVTNPS